MNVSPGTDDPNPATNPGQVDGNGCVYPARQDRATALPPSPTSWMPKYPPNPTTHVAEWREYAGDMGNTPSRDGGTPDPTGGTDCAHPAIGGADDVEGATATDQYANRHNPIIYFIP